jgi:hypothetical protein
MYCVYCLNNADCAPKFAYVHYDNNGVTSTLAGNSVCVCVCVCVRAYTRPSMEDRDSIVRETDVDEADTAASIVKWVSILCGRNREVNTHGSQMALITLAATTS